MSVRVISEPAELFFDPGSESLRFLPEGPYPLGSNRFSWVAIQHGPTASVGSLNIYDAKTGVNQSYALPGRPGFAFPTDRGNFVVGCERSVGIYSIADGSWKPFVQGVDSQVTGTIINDAVLWDGNLIFGTKDLEFKTQKAGLYLWRRADGKLIALRNDQICSNGKVVIPRADGAVDLLDIDSPTRKVVAYRLDIAAGAMDQGRVVVDLKDQLGVPDGMTMTLDGKSLIIALYNPQAADYGRTIQVGIASGALEREWQTVGSPQATCPQWVEQDGQLVLVITTAVEHMPSDRRSGAPHAGCLYRCLTGPSSESSILRNFLPVFCEPV
ncbi:MAG: SMP-30/gluconolactonase/LRE family protein [Planctomycetota bacterium]|nr:SMP-30/gluconolactonase/LRE family protein [Planctomycetota bacterium]